MALYSKYTRALTFENLCSYDEELNELVPEFEVLEYLRQLQV